MFEIVKILVNQIKNLARQIDSASLSIALVPSELDGELFYQTIVAIKNGQLVDNHQNVLSEDNLLEMSANDLRWILLCLNEQTKKDEPVNIGK